MTICSFEIAMTRFPQSKIGFNLLTPAMLVFLLTLPSLHAQTPATANSATGKPIFEEWVTIVLDGKRCGFGSTITTQTDTPAGPQYLTVHQEQFVVKRSSSLLKITETSKIIEDADGAVLSFSQSNQGAGSDIESSGVRQDDELIVSSRRQTQHYQSPRLGALGPEAIRRLETAVPLKPDQPFSFNTFDSDYPQAPVVESGRIVGLETRDVRGTQRRLWKVVSETNVMPGMLSSTWVDDRNNDVESLIVVPGIGDLHEYVTDRAECMKQPEGLDIFTGSLIRPQRAIPSPGEQASAVYRLTSVDLSRKLTLWDQGEQHVLSSTPGSSEVEVTAPHVLPTDATWQLPRADISELRPYLQASAYLEVNSPDIQALARQAVGGEKNPVLAAHLIESFVRRYITKKDLNVGFASAEETAKSREGDCTEHAVLCAALGRAAGLPTRCVLGFGYIPPGVEAPTVSNSVDKDTGIFAFHMWAEAWIGPNKWAPMDAALDGFDVGHIAITKSALTDVDPLVDLNTPVWQLMENLKIDVLKTESKSKAAAKSSTPPIPSDRSSPLRKPPATSEPSPPPPHLPPGVD
jgi:hypothetical protein